VKNRFQNSPFQCNLQRYTAEKVLKRCALALAAHEAYETLRSQGGRHGAQLEPQSAADTSANIRAEARALVAGVASCYVGVERCAAAAATEGGDLAAARAVVVALYTLHPVDPSLASAPGFHP
jgi:hypothetical protein